MCIGPGTLGIISMTFLQEITATLKSEWRTRKGRKRRKKEKGIVLLKTVQSQILEDEFLPHFFIVRNV